MKTLQNARTCQMHCTEHARPPNCIGNIQSSVFLMFYVIKKQHSMRVQLGAFFHIHKQLVSPCIFHIHKQLVSACIFHIHKQIESWQSWRSASMRLLHCTGLADADPEHVVFRLSMFAVLLIFFLGCTRRWTELHHTARWALIAGFL